MWTGSGMFVGSGACFLVAALALGSAVLSARLYDWRQVLVATGLGLLLTCGGVVLFWFGSTHPTFNVRNNQGFPPDWSCSTLTRGEQVCVQDAPAPSVSQARPK